MIRKLLAVAGTAGLLIIGALAASAPAAASDGVSVAAASDIKIVEVKPFGSSVAAGDVFNSISFAEIQNIGTTAFTLNPQDTWQLHKCNADVNQPAAVKVADIAPTTAITLQPGDKLLIADGPVNNGAALVAEDVTSAGLAFTPDATTNESLDGVKLTMGGTRMDGVSFDTPRGNCLGNNDPVTGNPAPADSPSADGLNVSANRVAFTDVNSLDYTLSPQSPGV